jgi:hypothetical protein
MIIHAAGDPTFANLNAFFTLGVRYATGRDVGQDLVAAHKWFNIAASLGHEEAKIERKLLAAEMTPSDVARAQKDARLWLAARQSRPSSPKPQPKRGADAFIAVLKSHKARDRAVFDWAQPA